MRVTTLAPLSLRRIFEDYLCHRGFIHTRQQIPEDPVWCVMQPEAKSKVSSGGGFFQDIFSFYMIFLSLCELQSLVMFKPKADALNGVPCSPGACLACARRYQLCPTCLSFPLLSPLALGVRTWGKRRVVLLDMGFQIIPEVTVRV